MPIQTKIEIEQKARSMWDAFNKSEKHGVRFGLFPNAAMEAAEKEGFPHQPLVVALMDIEHEASKNGGMIG